MSGILFNDKETIPLCFPSIPPEIFHDIVYDNGPPYWKDEGILISPEALLSIIEWDRLCLEDECLKDYYSF